MDEVIMETFGDPGLTKIIQELRCARKELNGDEVDPDDDEDMTVEEMEREESRYIDRQNARDINRRFG